MKTFFLVLIAAVTLFGQNNNQQNKPRPAAKPATEDSQPIPAPGRVVKYAAPEPGAKKTAMPNLKGAVVGINFEGPLADELRGVLLKKGITRFVEGDGDRCHVPNQAVVCFSLDKALSSGQYSFSSSAASGQSSASGSSTLNQFGVRATARLVKPDSGDEYNEIALGYALGWRDAGTTSESGGGPFSSGSSSITTPEQVAIAQAQRMAIMRLVDNYRLLEIGGRTKMWYPNAGADIKAAFGEQ